MTFDLHIPYKMLAGSRSFPLTKTVSPNERLGIMPCDDQTRILRNLPLHSLLLPLDSRMYFFSNFFSEHFADPLNKYALEFGER